MFRNERNNNSRRTRLYDDKTFGRSICKVEHDSPSPGWLAVVCSGARVWLQPAPEKTSAARKCKYTWEVLAHPGIDGQLTLTEVAPGINVEGDILQRANTEILVSPDLKEMEPALFIDKKINLDLKSWDWITKDSQFQSKNELLF